MIKRFIRLSNKWLGTSSETIAESDKGGPNYRVVHTGTVISNESVNLRKIGGSLGGATGDQSYSEAISGSDIVVYETLSHKRDLVKGMIALAQEIDLSGKHRRSIELLAYSKAEEE